MTLNRGLLRWHPACALGPSSRASLEQRVYMRVAALEPTHGAALVANLLETFKPIPDQLARLLDDSAAFAVRPNRCLTRASRRLP